MRYIFKWFGNRFFFSEQSSVSNLINTSVGQYSSFIGNGINYRILLNGGNSSILGGSTNTVSSSYSTILGGAGNTVSAAYGFAAVFGQNINAVASNTFHVACLNACATPVTPGPVWPSGTIFKYSGIGLPAGALPLYIMP